MTTDQFKLGQEIVDKVLRLSRKVSQLESIDKNGLKDLQIQSLSHRTDESFSAHYNPNDTINGVAHQPQSIQILLNVTVKMMIEYYKAEIEKLEAEFKSL